MDCSLAIPVVVNLPSADAREDAVNGCSLYDFEVSIPSWVKWIET